MLSKFRLRFLTAVFLLIFALIIMFADQGKMPKFISTLYAFPNGDKVGHFFLIGVLSFLINLSIFCRKIQIGSRTLLFGSLAVSIIITLEEFSQLFFPSRSFSLIDLSFSYLGIWFFGYLASWFISKVGFA